jgi:hypothetical protein
MHRHNEIVYLDKTAKMGACEECLLKLVRAGHELMPIGKTVREVTNLLSQLEKKMTDLNTRKKTEKMEFQNSLGVLKADRETFAIEQSNRVQQLKNYLDEKMRQAIADFNRATEYDLFRIKSNLARAEEHILEAGELMQKAQGLR